MKLCQNDGVLRKLLHADVSLHQLGTVLLLVPDMGSGCRSHEYSWQMCSRINCLLSRVSGSPLNPEYPQALRTPRVPAKVPICERHLCPSCSVCAALQDLCQALVPAAVCVTTPAQLQHILAGG